MKKLIKKNYVSNISKNFLQYKRVFMAKNKYIKNFSVKDVRVDQILFYQKVDSIYKSYWFGKLLNSFIKNGKKALAFKKIYTSLIALKYINQINPLLFILETLEKIKLIFNLKIWHFKRRRNKGKKVQQKEKHFPMLISKKKQYLISLQWILKTLKYNSSINIRSSIIKTNFIIFLYEKLVDLSQNLRSLILDRDRYYKQALFFDHRLRYPWQKKKRNWIMSNYFYRAKYFKIKKILKENKNFFKNKKKFKNYKNKNDAFIFRKFTPLLKKSNVYKIINK
jgi:ribosomal protein S7